MDVGMGIPTSATMNQSCMAGKKSPSARQAAYSAHVFQLACRTAREARANSEGVHVTDVRTSLKSYSHVERAA